MEIGELHRVDESYDVGIIGAGYVTAEYHCPVIEALPPLNLKWIADVDYQSAKEKTKLFSGRPVKVGSPSDLPSCDVAILATPVTHRKDYIRELGNRGTPVLSEKPFAISLSEHNSLTDAADMIAVNYLRTYYSPIQQLRELLDLGLEDSIESVRIQRGWIGGSTGFSSGLYRTNPEAGGVLMERGCHTLSQIVHLFQNYSLSVKSARIAKIDGIDAEFQITITAENKHHTFEIVYEHSNMKNILGEMRVVYDTSEIVFNHMDSSTPPEIHSSESSKKSSIGISEDWATSGMEGNLHSWIQFLRYIETNNHLLGPDPTLPEVTRLIENARETASVTEVNDQ